MPTRLRSDAPSPADVRSRDIGRRSSSPGPPGGSSVAGLTRRSVESLGETVATLPPREATLVAPPEMPRELTRALSSMGAQRLYSHQLEAYERLRVGENVIVATATASGKSLCYKIPAFENALKTPSNRALFLYPTKALAQDEAHLLRGVFGSHVAAVLRRLRRVAELHGADPKFVLTSATIANPLELAEVLTGLPFALVDKDGASSGERRVVFRNPPLKDEEKGDRRSMLTEGAFVFSRLVSQGVRTIAFAKSRKAAELIYRYAADRRSEERRVGKECR